MNVVIDKTKAVTAYSSTHRLFTEGQRLAMIAADGDLHRFHPYRWDPDGCWEQTAPRDSATHAMSARAKSPPPATRSERSEVRSSGRPRAQRAGQSEIRGGG
jgi:hypothetical protein